MSSLSLSRFIPPAVGILLSAVLLQIAFATGSANATNFDVRSADELQAALAKVQGGDSITVAAGSYGALIVGNKGAFRFSESVEISAADPAHKPVFSHLEILNASNLKLKSLIVDYAYSQNDPPQFEAAKISSSENISIIDCVFDGDTAQGTGTYADGFPTAIGLRVKNSKFVSLERSRFSKWLRGATFRIVENLEVIGNELSEIRSDGLDFAQVTNALVEDNHLHDFRMAPGSPDHRDMIQFWTKETTAPSSNVVIRNNFLEMGTGSPTQSIFMRNEVVDQNEGGTEMFYKDIRIEGNLIRNAHVNAIAVGETDGLSISRNTLLQAVSIQQGGKVSVPALSVAERSVGVTVSANLLPRFAKIFKSPPSDWRVSDNVLLQRLDPSAHDYYGNIFINPLAEKTLQREDLAIIPTSVLAEKSAGSPLSKFNVAPKHSIGIVSHTRGNGTVLSQHIALSEAYGPTGPLDLASAEIKWSFGDGGTSTGNNVEHDYDAAGLYVVKCEVTIPGQDTFKCERTIAVGY